MCVCLCYLPVLPWSHKESHSPHCVYKERLFIALVKILLYTTCVSLCVQSCWNVMRITSLNTSPSWKTKEKTHTQKGLQLGMYFVSSTTGRFFLTPHSVHNTFSERAMQLSHLPEPKLPRLNKNRHTLDIGGKRKGRKHDPISSFKRRKGGPYCCSLS